MTRREAIKTLGTIGMAIIAAPDLLKSCVDENDTSALLKSIDDKITYQNYLSNLEAMLNNGQYREVEEIYKNSKKIEVPIKREVLEGLKSEFTHEIEHALLLFVNPNGVINTVITAPSSSASKMHYNIDDEKADYIVQKMKEIGLTFVGTYHDHTRTKEEILEEPRGQPYMHQENAPSPHDIHYFKKPAEYRKGENGKYPDSKHAWKRKEKIMLVGGLNSETFKYEVRAFTATHHTHGIKKGFMDLSPDAEKFYKELRESYRQYHRFDRSGCVEFTIKSVD